MHTNGVKHPDTLALKTNLFLCLFSFGFLLFVCFVLFCFVLFFNLFSLRKGYLSCLDGCLIVIGDCFVWESFNLLK